MKRAVLAAAAAALAAFAVASLASAAAPTKGRLIVSNPATNVGAAASTTLTSIQAPNTFRTTIYVPAGYRAGGGLGQVGNNVGKAQVYAKQADGSRITLNGQISVVPNTTTANTACESNTGTHAAVWMLKATQTKGNATIQFPIYVDSQTTDSNLPPSAAYMLQYCSGGRGLNVSEVDLDLVKMFANPQARGMYTWRAVYEPSTDGKTIESSQSVGVAADVPINTQVTMKAIHVRNKPHWMTFTGFVSVVNHPLAGVKVQLFIGHDRHLNLTRPKAIVRTGAQGNYRVTLKLPGNRAWYARAKATSPYKDITAGGGCASVKDNLATTNCADATLSSFIVVSNPLLRVS